MPKVVLNVLVLEDSPADAELVMRAVRSAGIGAEWRRVDTAESFTEALQAAKWDVILADFSVPGFGAGSALDILQELGLDIPFIVVSGSIGEELAVTLLRAGADDFIVKERLARLAPAIERAIREARQRQERRRAQEENRVLAERWRRVLEYSLDAITLHQVIRDAQGRMIDFRILEWNRAAETILGLGRVRAIGHTGRELLPALVGSGLLVRLVRMMETGGSERIEDCTTRKVSPARTLDITSFPLDSEHFVALIRDVTERKEAERRLREYADQVALVNEKLEQANAELARRNAELEEFAHVASHDLQEPLRKVVSFGDLLARALGDNLDARASQYLKFMQDSTRRLRALIQDLLVMSRADRAPLQLELTPIDDCVREALDLLSARIQETKACVRVDPLPTLMVDPRQMVQLYQNLLSNALKFVRDGTTPEVHVTCETGWNGPVLGVADNGIGIEPEYQEKVFEAFQRLHPRDKYEGSGIGLAVCRKIVARHGGRLWVESKLGEGSHFRFVLDAGQTQQPPPAKASLVSA